MNNQSQDALDHVRQSIQSLDPYADIYVLFPASYTYDLKIDIYILTPKVVDYALEQQYINARYAAEKLSTQEINIHLINKTEWHQHYIDSKLYDQVHNEGVLL
nr:hypothetical protein [uncultured Carboxylicivirga sp.]